MNRLLSHHEGFSILEALVAIAVLAATLLPLYHMQSTLADAAYRAEGLRAAIEAESNALAYLQLVDPLEEPDGETEIGGWTLSWTSQLLANEENADGYMGGRLYSVWLYEVEATLSRGSRERELTVRRLVWRRTGNPLPF
jgi:general secretion pathway protein I